MKDFRCWSQNKLETSQDAIATLSKKEQYARGQFQGLLEEVETYK